MWRKIRLLVMLASAVLCLSLASPLGSCSEAQTTRQADALTVSRTDWNALKANNAAQRKALEESKQELSEARTALNASRTALAEARSLLEVSQMTSTEAQERLIQLSQEYETQKAELEMLRRELAALKAESVTVSDALLKVNQYLQDTKAEIEANEATHRKRENQLERQRLFWQIACLVVGGVAAAV